VDKGKTKAVATSPRGGDKQKKVKKLAAVIVDDETQEVAGPSKSGSGGSGNQAFLDQMDRLLVLSVCALLLCLWMPYLVITSSPSFHGSSHDLWLVFSFVSLCLLCLYS